MDESGEAHPSAHEVLVAVFAPDQVEPVRQELDRQGCPAEAVHVGDDDDLRWSLRAEQTEETDRSLVAPPAGLVMTKEATKAASIAVPVGALVGAVLLLPFAVIEAGDLQIWLRLLWCAIVGATLGGTVGYLAGTAMAAKDSFEPNAAQRGVVVRVDRPTPAIEAALVALAPIRIDRFDRDGVVLGVVATEEDRQPGGIVEEVAANVAREAGATPTDRHR